MTSAVAFSPTPVDEKRHDQPESVDHRVALGPPCPSCRHRSRARRLAGNCAWIAHPAALPLVRRCGCVVRATGCAADRASVRTGLARPTGERSCRRCPSAETQSAAAASATSILWAPRSSRYPPSEAGWASVARPGHQSIEQTSHQSPFRIGQATRVALLRRLPPTRCGVLVATAIRRRIAPHRGLVANALRQRSAPLSAVTRSRSLSGPRLHRGGALIQHRRRPRGHQCSRHRIVPCRRLRRTPALAHSQPLCSDRQ